MEQQELIPHLFRTEYRKIVAVLSRLFGLEHVELAEDLASDTFLLAAETWGIKGMPENPAAWLYTVAKNKAKDYLRRHRLFTQKIAPQLQASGISEDAFELDLSEQHINDSQLQMMFALCHPAIPAEAQIGLSLRILCGFGIGEIAAAFLTTKETINKRLTRAREKLREVNAVIALPGDDAIQERLETVALTLYLLFNEGYYSSAGDNPLRRELCVEAMRLAFLLAENAVTDRPFIRALLALMCFQASRFDARTGPDGEIILYHDQQEAHWDQELIRQGYQFLCQASESGSMSRFHLEAGIAFWHTRKDDSPGKWEQVLQLYNKLLLDGYSPVVALNRTYALAKVRGKQEALAEARKLGLGSNHLYHMLMAELHSGSDEAASLEHLRLALALAASAADRRLIAARIAEAERQPAGKHAGKQ